MRIGLSAAGLTSVLAMAAGVAGGTTRYVSPLGNESGGYTNWTMASKTIQKAVDACVDGDRVVVTNGTYMLTSQISVTKAITVVSLHGATATAIDGQDAHRCLFISATNAVVDGFTIRNGRGGETWHGGGGVAIFTNGVVRNSIIRDCKAAWFAGVWMLRGGTLQNCLVMNNVVLNSGEPGGGVSMQEKGTVENCTIVGNQAPICAGICFDESGNQEKVINCVIRDNVGGDVGFYHSSPVADITYSCFTPYIAGTGNITSDPMFVNAAIGDFRLSTNSPCINTGINQSWMPSARDLDGKTRITNGTVDMGAYESGFFIGLRYSAVDVYWDSTPGTTYQLQSCTNLVNPVWSNVGSPLTATGIASYVSDVIRDTGGKFYRVQELP